MKICKKRALYLLAAQPILMFQLCNFLLEQLDVPPALGNLLISLRLLPGKDLAGRQPRCIRKTTKTTEERRNLLENDENQLKTTKTTKKQRKPTTNDEDH
jgi:hypothetical protein